METYLSSIPQVTFAKSIYKRYTNFIKFNRTYTILADNGLYSDTKPNTIKVESFNYSILNEITLEINDINNVNDIQIYVEKQKSNTQTFMPQRTTLCNIPRAFLETGCKKLSPKIYSLKNFINNVYPLFLIDRAKYDLFVTINYIKPKDKTDLNDSVTVRYSKLLGEEERRKFDQVDHEYLIKAYKYIKYDLNEGNNVIRLNELKDKCVALVYLNFPQNNALNSGKLVMGDKEIPDILIDNSINIHHSFAYILDPGSNVELEDQPHGHYNFNENSTLELNMYLPQSVYITYVEYDVLRITHKKDSGLYQYVLSEATEQIKQFLAPPYVSPNPYMDVLETLVKQS